MGDCENKEKLKRIEASERERERKTSEARKTGGEEEELVNFKHLMYSPPACVLLGGLWRTQHENLGRAFVFRSESETRS